MVSDLPSDSPNSENRISLFIKNKNNKQATILLQLTINRSVTLLIYSIKKGTLIKASMVAINCPASILPIIRFDCRMSKILPNRPQKHNNINDVIGNNITYRIKIIILLDSVDKLANTPAMKKNTEIKIKIANVLKEMCFCAIVKNPVVITPNIPDIKNASFRLSPCVFKNKVSTTTR